MRDYEACAHECDRGLEFGLSSNLLRLRGDALVELRFFRKALRDYDMIAQLYTESNQEQQSGRDLIACRPADLQDLLRRKHETANQFLQQADDMTGLLLSEIDSKIGANRPDSSSAQEEQMGMFHGLGLHPATAGRASGAKPRLHQHFARSHQHTGPGLIKTIKLKEFEN